MDELPERILRAIGGPEVVARLAGLSGSDFTSLMLAVARQRAAAQTPASVLRQYRGNRFVAPAGIGWQLLRTAEDALAAHLPPGTELVTLPPLAPLGTHAVLGPMSQDKVVTTMRASEVAADPTNALALEAAFRRQAAATSGRATDGRAADGRAADGRANDGTHDGRAAGGRAADGRANDGTHDRRAAGGRAADGRAADGRAADGRAADGRAADGRAADGRANDGRANDGRANDGTSHEGRAADGSAVGRRTAGGGAAGDGSANDGRATVRLAAFQRVVRAPRPAPGYLSHFSLLGMVTAGRDDGGHRFERQAVAEHARALVAGLAAAGLGRVQLALTPLSPAGEAAAAVLPADLADVPVEVVLDRERQAGRGYYRDLCFKLNVAAGTGWAEVGDGGFTDWVARLTGSAKERLLISGMGIDRVVMLAPGSAG